MSYTLFQSDEGRTPQERYQKALTEYNSAVQELLPQLETSDTRQLRMHRMLETMIKLYGLKKADSAGKDPGLSMLRDHAGRLFLSKLEADSSSSRTPNRIYLRNLGESYIVEQGFIAHVLNETWETDLQIGVDLTIYNAVYTLGLIESNQFDLSPDDAMLINVAEACRGLLQTAAEAYPRSFQARIREYRGYHVNHIRGLYEHLLKFPWRTVREGAEFIDGYYRSTVWENARETFLRRLQDYDSVGIAILDEYIPAKIKDPEVLTEETLDEQVSLTLQALELLALEVGGQYFAGPLDTGIHQWMEGRRVGLRSHFLGDCELGPGLMEGIHTHLLDSEIRIALAKGLDLGTIYVEKLTQSFLLRHRFCMDALEITYHLKERFERERRELLIRHLFHTLVELGEPYENLGPLTVKNSVWRINGVDEAIDLLRDVGWEVLDQLLASMPDEVASIAADLRDQYTRHIAQYRELGDSVNWQTMKYYQSPSDSRSYFFTRLSQLELNVEDVLGRF